jgi:hypothetical protein
MSDRIVEEMIIFLVVGAVVVAAIWQFGASRRGKAALTRDADYRTIADRAIAVQEATEGRLADVTDQLTEMNLRVAAMERVLKDVE